jgi:flagellin
MALSINTNLYALNAQRNLRKSESPLTTAMQRLSSTLRINSAKDDAAGLAIATRMTRQVNGLTVAMRNGNDGVSFAQTAEGAMDEMITALQRIYELAEQSASYNTSLDRDSMNQEVSELISELNRIVTQTRYNGEQFLNQTKSIDVQVGVEVNETINISTTNVSPTEMGVSSSYSTTLGASDVAKSGYIAYNAETGITATLEGTTLGGAFSAATEFRNNSLNVINRINQYTGDTGVTAFGFGNSLTLSTAGVYSASASGEVGAGALTINGTQIGTFTAASGSSSTVANLIGAINNKSGTTGVVAVGLATDGALQSGAAYTTDTKVVLANTTGAAISVSYNSGVAVGSALDTWASGNSSWSVSAGQNGRIILNDSFNDTSVSFSTATHRLIGLASTVSAGTTATTLTQTSINSISVNTVGNANIAILAAKQGLETFNTEKAKLGAKMNRLESTIRNLDVVRENITSARSRIMDADFAAETANLTRALIMQQAGISILSQANTLPQNVLALLGGR